MSANPYSVFTDTARCYVHFGGLTKWTRIGATKIAK